MVQRRSMEKAKDEEGKKVVEKAKTEEEDDCYVIDPEDFFRKLTVSDPCDSDDVILVAEKGPVALRDFPHPRHLCANFPFNSTAHESHCSKCFCYVCEVAAPCRQWNGSNGHCNVSTKEKPQQLEASLAEDKKALKPC
ncbi:hypothetical protein Cni_G15035 [Canna indica]|uniref:Uncharacterized protein n=1 Tax=Canna indica TaxID=4628 RepID=A0AAQ3KCL4_9LILI|nr:hypothetical protein Cni_G15035 [Canna indica]